MAQPLERLRLAMVGGGPGAFIGPVHRMAAELDGRFRLVAGAFSRDPDKSRQAGGAYGLDAERAYPDYQALIAGEAARPDGAQVVAVVTPNHLHFAVSKAALEAGLHVMCDKPATATLAEALALRAVIAASGRQFGLTYTYAGYAMAREAREIVRSGRLGRIRKVTVEYSQGWLAQPLERGDHKQAAWRADPAQAGLGGCIGDIGVHALHLAEFVSGLKVSRLCPDLSSVVEGRVLDDDCNVLLRFDNNAPGVLVASQIATGDRNGLRVRVYGEACGLDWRHDDPQVLVLNWPDRPVEILHAAAPYLTPAGRASARAPTGHPEGYIEAFANLYRDFADAIQGAPPAPGASVPDIGDGIRGMAFIEAAVTASQSQAGWVALSAEA